MTRRENELLRRNDPDFYRAQKWRDRLVGGLAIVAIAALIAAAYAVVVNQSQGIQITRITKSACQAHPASEACAKIRQRVARNEPIENPCISYQRVTGSEGRNCPRHFVSPPAAEEAEEGGGALQKPHSPARQQPGPRTGASPATPQLPASAGESQPGHPIALAGDRTGLRNGDRCGRPGLHLDRASRPPL